MSDATVELLYFMARQKGQRSLHSFESFPFVYQLHPYQSAVSEDFARTFKDNKLRSIHFAGSPFRKMEDSVICGTPGFQEILQSVESVCFRYIHFDSDSISQLLDAMLNSETLKSLRFYECSLLVPGSSVKMPPVTTTPTTSPKILSLLQMHRCDNNFVDALSTLFKVKPLLVDQVCATDNSKLTKIRPILASSKYLFFEVLTGVPDFPQELAQAFHEHPSLEKLHLDYYVDEDMAAMVFEAVQSAIAHGGLKHFSCPARLLLGRPLQGPWTQLESLEIPPRGYVGSRNGGLSDEEVATLSASLLALSRSSDTLTKVKASFEFESDTAMEVQQWVTGNFVGVPHLGPGGCVPMETVISVLSRVQDVDESRVTAIRGQDGLSLDTLQTTVTYDVVRRTVPTIVQQIIVANSQLGDKDASSLQQALSVEDEEVQVSICEGGNYGSGVADRNLVEAG
mmetsp:Transcript_31847/g.47340  ORF Transcript_31847/g.47340 Transcript_31847/m.47340 type:complete len:454 (-) Transcript_31847:285-1646(-)